MRRFEGLDALRGSFALGVLVLHVWMFDWGDEGQPARATWEWALGELRLGLVMFFVLSGFLLTAPYVAAALGDRPWPRVGSYAKRRIARVVPAYLVAILGSIAVLAGTGNAKLPETGELWRFLFFLQSQDADTHNTLNPPTWSLTVEMTFYVLLPLLALLLLRARRRALLVAGALAVASAGLLVNWWAAATDQPATVTTSIVTFFPYFAMGLAAAALLHGRELRPAASIALALGGLALVAANGVWHVRGDSFGELVVRDLPAGAGFALMVAGCTGAAGRPFGWAPLRGLGTVSYGLYLWHFPMIYLLRTRDIWPDDLAVSITAVLVPSLLLAIASWYVVERPAIRLARRERQATPVHGRPPAPASSPLPHTAPPRSRPAEAREPARA